MLKKSQYLNTTGMCLFSTLNGILFKAIRMFRGLRLECVVQQKARCHFNLGKKPADVKSAWKKDRRASSPPSVG